MGCSICRTYEDCHYHGPLWWRWTATIATIGRGRILWGVEVWP